MILQLLFAQSNNSLVVEHIDREQNGIKMIFTPEKHNVS
jgi:hypothetical protein